MRVTSSLGIALVGLILSASVAVSDDQNINFDAHTDFSTLKTFAMREGKVDSPRPELNNTLVLKKISDAIRAELIAKGLKETVNNPDVIVDFNVTAEDFNEQRGGPVTSTEGTLVVDMTKRDSRALVWRGVYRDSEKNTAKLAQKLPVDVKKFVSLYPPKQKGPIQPGLSSLAAAQKLSPKAAAASALEIVKATTADTAFVGPAAHPGLSIVLAGLERAATAVSEDDGRSPAATTNRHLAFYEALNSAADYAASIASRGVETADSKTKSRSLASKLRDLNGA